MSQQNRGVISIGLCLDVYRKYSVYAMLAVTVGLSFWFIPYFGSPYSLINVVQQNSSVFIVACGMQLVLIGGEVDMSSGAVAGFCGCLASYVMVHVNNLIVSLASGICAGMIIGWVNGFLVIHFNAPSFIITTAMQLIISGLTYSLTNAQPIYGIGELSALGSAYGKIVSMPGLIMILAGVLTWFLLNVLRYGRLLYAVGSNREASRTYGIPIRLIVKTTFVLQGLMAAVGGIILMARLNSGQPTGAEEYNISAITAVVIGGTSIRGGMGNIYGTIAGVFFIGILTNLLTYAGVNATYQQIVQGFLIIIAVIADTQDIWEHHENV